MKKFFTGLCIVAILLLAMAVAAPFVVDINRFKDPILDIAQKQLGRSLEVKRISWKMLPSLAVLLENVAVQESRNPVAPTVLSAGRLDLVLRWGPLLHKNIEIKSVILTGLQARIRKGADGTFSLEALPGNSFGEVSESASLAVSRTEIPTSAKKAKSEKSNSSARAVDLSRFRLNDLEIADGHVEYREEKKDGPPLNLRFDKIALHASDIALGEKIRFKSSAKIGGEDGFPVAVSGWVGPIGEEALSTGAWEDVAGDIHLSANAVDTSLFSSLGEMPQCNGKANLDVDLHQEGGKLSFDADFRGDDMDLRMPGKFHKPAGEIFRWKASGVVADQKIQIERASVALAAAKGTLRKASYDLRTHDFEAGVNANVNLENLQTWMDQQTGALAQGQATLDAEISGNTNRLRDVQVEGTLDLDSVHLRWPGVLRRPIEGKGSVTMQKDLIRLRSLELKVGRSDLRLDGKVRMRGTERGEISVESDYLDVEELLNVLERPQPRKVPRVQPLSAPLPSGSFSQAPAEKGEILKALPANTVATGVIGAPPGTTSPQGLAKWTFQGTCKIKELVYQRNRLTDLQGGLFLEDGVFTLSRLTAQGYRGSLSTALQVDLLDPHFAFRWGIRTNDMQIDDLIAANSNFGGRISGRANAQLELAGRVTDGLDGLLQSLNGNGQVEMGDMTIATFDMMDKLSALTGLLGMRQPQMDQTHFDFFRTPVQIRDGRVFTPNVEAQGSDFDLAGRGSFGFDRTLDYNVQVTLSRERTAQLGRGQLVQALMTADGRMAIPFAMNGRIDGPPHFSPLWQDILTRQAAYQLERQLFRSKRKQPAQQQEPYATNPADSNPSSTEATLEDLLTQILKK